VRRRSLAAAVVRKTFAAEPPHRHELFTTAGILALEELGKHRRTYGREEDREGYDFTRIDAGRLADPSAVLFDRELIELVWDCAAALDPEDYALLDLHLRQGLNSHAAGLTQLRDSFEDTVTSTLLMRRARRSCDYLDVLLANAERQVEAEAVLMAVRRHSRSCPVCRDSKRRFVSPLAVFVAFAPIAPPRGFKAALWSELQPPTRRRWIF
jgi:hypothetical protein